jgi:hypothetical protein
MTLTVVAAVVEKERIALVLPEPTPRVFGGDGACLTAVARETGSPIAAERFAFEKDLPAFSITIVVALPIQRYSRNA